MFFIFIVFVFLLGVLEIVFGVWYCSIVSEKHANPNRAIISCNIYDLIIQFMQKIVVLLK